MASSQPKASGAAGGAEGDRLSQYCHPAGLVSELRDGLPLPECDRR